MKKGSDLFYADPSDQDVQAKLKSSASVDAPTVAKVMAPLEKGENERGLTEPVLQKQPLDFGNATLKISPQPGAEPAAPTDGNVIGNQ